MIALIAAIAAVAAIGVVASVKDRNARPSTTTAASTANPNPMSPGKKQPPGPVPAGKVWSEEHGHWHDINVAPTQPTAAQPITVGNTAKAPVPQPPGTPPPGKVWSPEHGHWHDAPR